MKITEAWKPPSETDKIKPSAVTRIIKFLIIILLIPVRKENGEYCQKWISCKTFFSCLIWSVCPTLSLGFTFFSHANKYQEYYASNQLRLYCYIVFSVLILVSYWIITPSMGYLVQQCKQIQHQMFIAPVRKLEILIFNIFNIIAVIIVVSEEEAALVVVLFITTYSVYEILLASSMFLVDAYTSTFIRRCKNFKHIIKHEMMLAESKFLLEAYINLRTGLEPSLALHHFVSLPTIIIYSYWGAAEKFSIYAVCLILSYTILIRNIASLSQECYEELQSISDVLR